MTKRLPWERSRLTHAKRELDRVYLKSVKKRSRKARLPRVLHTEVSSQPIPSEPALWAVDTGIRWVPVTHRNYSSLDESSSSTPITEPRATSTPLASRLSHKLLGNFSATFEIFGNFLEFWQLLEFSATLGFLRFFKATFFTFWPTLVSFR